MPQIKARTDNDLKEKIKKAVAVSDYSYESEFIRDAVEEKADEILVDILDTDDEIPENDEENGGMSEQTDPNPTYDNLVNNIEDGLQDFERHIRPGEEDWTDKENVVSMTYRQRLPVLRGMLVYQADEVVDGDGRTVPDGVVWGLMESEFNLSKPSKYNYIEHLQDYDAAYPDLGADPEWDEREILQEVQDWANRKNHPKQGDIESISDVAHHTISEYGESKRIYDAADVWYLDRAQYEGVMRGHLKRLEVAVFDVDDGPVDLYRILLRYFLTYLSGKGFIGEEWQRVRSRLEKLE
ncbi:hypothetical protein [Halosimplex halobium]|uniref:hypothetical protein n=1 Tax=Halosimplex halobium TaxID=3396618 RepID=UPI003F572433